VIKPYPERIVIELTPGCNLSCSMCPRHHIDGHKGLMTEKLWQKLIDDIKQHSPKSIVIPFWRGEATLHPKFSQFIDYANKKSLEIHLSSNGERLTDTIINSLLKCQFVTFSIHTDKALENAINFIKNNNIVGDVQISFVNNEATSKHLDTITKDPNLMGFSSIRLYEEHTIDGVFGQSQHQKASTSREFCPLLENNLVFAYDGKVSRCNHIWNPIKNLNINDKSIQEIWNTNELKTIRNQYPDTLCKPCDQWHGHTKGKRWELLDHNIKETHF
jgi:MoaA/NifB/PqqE/SkfB family radical SAM enzyme